MPTPKPGPDQVAPPSEDEQVSGAVRGAPTGLPYEAAGLAEEASLGLGFGLGRTRT